MTQRRISGCKAVTLQDFLFSGNVWREFSLYLMKEEELIYKAQKGEKEAFGRLYDEYFPRIYRFIFLKVSRKEDAEDLSHQVFMSAWKNISGYTMKGLPFGSWLYKISQNAVIDFYRTKKTHFDIEEINEEKLGVSGDAEREVNVSIEMEKVRRALKLLKEDEQTILIMKFVDELGNKEIADVTGKTEGAIRVIQHRALKQLKKILEEESKLHGN